MASWPHEFDFEMRSERSREMRYFAILALYGCTELRDYIKGVVDACNI